MITIQKNGEIAIVTLQRPPANALDLELTVRIRSTFADLGNDDSVRAVVLTGHGRSFCAGLDLKSVPALDKGAQKKLLDALNGAFLSVFDCPVPVVAGINGHAIAGGLVLALACDWRIAAKTSFLVGLTEVRVGIPYPVGAIEVVRSELAPRMLRELVLLGQNMSQEAALETGIFDECIEQDGLIRAAERKARELAQLPRVGYTKVKRALRREARERIIDAVAGNEPLYDDWLSEETLAAAQAILHAKG